MAYTARSLMNRLFFYLGYASRNLRRGGRWTALAVLCIAAGVATVVALRGLGLSIADSLIESVRIDIKGDILMVRRFSTGVPAAVRLDDERQFSASELDLIDAFAREQGIAYSGFYDGGNFQVSALDEDSGTAFGRPQFISTKVIDPATYPPYGPILALDPPGIPLGALFTDDFDIVISENMALAQGLSVGDRVRVSSTTEQFVVRGIVATTNEATIRNPFAGFFGFAYMAFDDARMAISPDIMPDSVALAYPQALSRQQMEAERDRLRLLPWQNGAPRFDTAVDAVDRNETIAQILGDFIVVMGLGALLIGGVGILNTMLVMVRRRTNEIAALKTFGLKARQVAALFLAEAFWLGLVGSIVGCIVGVLLGAAVNGYGETFLNQQLVWRIYPEALVYGFVLGLSVTAIFGIAPIMTALQVRPGIILRPNEVVMPGLGILQTILLVILVTIAIGLMVGQIISPSFALASNFNAPSPYLVGVIGVAVTLVLLAVLVCLLWLIVWLVGKTPDLGNVDVRLALRNLATNRTRTAVTLLALSAGMFALSSITFIGQGTRELLNLQLSSWFGGNVLVFPIAPGGTAVIGEIAINNALSGVEGVRSRTILESYFGVLQGIDGDPAPTTRLRTGFGPNAGRRDNAEMNDEELEEFMMMSEQQSAASRWNNISIWNGNNPSVYESAQIVAGRALTLEDRGKPVLVGPYEYAAILGIRIGSILTYEIGNRTYDLEVVGLSNSNGFGFGGGFVTFAPESLPGTQPSFQIYAFDVEPTGVNQVLVELSSIRIPPTVAIDVGFLDSLLSRLIDQFAAIPTIVGLLSLLAAAVIMANTVALATLERRRQIGILKAIGLKSRRVLRIMLIETTTIALLSAILGIGLSIIFVSIFTGLTGTVIPLPTDSRIAALALLLTAIFIGGLATFLSANVAVRERVMNVLRYE